MTSTQLLSQSPRPIVGLSDEYPPGFVYPLHSHSRSQLLYASNGVMSVTTATASFVIPPQRAIWIPAEVEHEVYCRGHVSLRTLYLAADLAFLHHPHCLVVEVTELLKVLVIEVVNLGPAYAPSDRNNRLIELLLMELTTMPHAPYQAPMPRDYRLLRVARAIIAAPADQHDLDTLAKIAGMGRRTFTRAFRAETGMSVAIWRQQVRLMQALSLLASGVPITSVAFDVGYDSPSAFTAMFHRSFGVPPSQYEFQTR